MDLTRRHLEKKSGAECDLINCGGLAQEILKEKNDSVLPTNNSSDILAKNVIAFLPLSENFACG